MFYANLEALGRQPDPRRQGAVDIEYPSLLGQPAAHLRAFPPETVVAEKFQAMVALGMINTRLKDFYEIWAIAGAFTFDGAVLSHAIQATFDRRQTPSHHIDLRSEGMVPILPLIPARFRLDTREFVNPPRPVLPGGACG